MPDPFFDDEFEASEPVPHMNVSEAHSIQTEHDEPNAPDTASAHSEVDAPTSPTSPPRWRCMRCRSADHAARYGWWVCSQCGHDDFYEVDKTIKAATDEGTWMYIPRVAGDVPPTTSSSRRRRRRRQRGGDPQDHQRPTMESGQNQKP